LLKLKKLQILGFKSFCDRTELKFHGEGIAAIVGPNGCGKSNLADAISWVLGEQSAKTLRGARMEDVIFAGTRERNPMGLAEVSLTLIDPEFYQGADLNAATEIDVQDQLPADDWDEAATRAEAAQQTAQAAAELQPAGDENLESEVATSVPPAALPPEDAGGQAASEAPGPPANPASAGRGSNPVVLKIRRRKSKSLHFQAGEIVVTRRLFRSGESEYLLNGRSCRLRDIQEMFMGTGLGPESYAIIEQGRIGQILSSRPHDRRAIIEEAAGITKFKTRKRLAEARLEQAKLNLARINDIFEEVARQMNSLKRQAAKAERYARLREEMRAKLKMVLASRLEQMSRQSAELETQSQSIAEEMRHCSENVDRLEEEHRQATQRGYSLESEAQLNRERLSAMALEADRGAARRRTNEERCSELAARSAGDQAERARAGQQLAALRGELATNRALVESAAAEVAAAEAAAALRQQEAAAAAAALADLERGQETRRGELLETLAGVSELRNQIIQAEENAAALGREAERVQRELSTTGSEAQDFGDRRGQRALEFESVRRRAAALAARIAETRAALEARRAQESEAKGRVDALRAEYATALGKKASLEAVIAEHGYATESVKRLFQSGALGGGFAPAGVLADFVEVEGQYESMVEDFLRDELNYVVVKSWDAADEGLRLLRSDVDGRATFLVHPDDAQARFSFAVEETARPSGVCGGPLIPLTRCLRTLNGFGRSLEVILPKLREGYIADGAAAARELALQNPKAFFLAPSGECFHNVTVTGGRQRSGGPLSMKRELRELLRQSREIERALADGEAAVHKLEREIRELNALGDRLEEEKRETDKQALTSEHALAQLDADLGRARERAAIFHRELERLGEERGQKHALIAGRREQLAADEGRRAELERQIAAGQQELPRRRAEREAAAQAAAAIAAGQATLEERRRAAAASLERIQSLAAEVASRIQTLQAHMDQAAAEEAQRQAETLEISSRLTALAGERELAEARGLQLHSAAERLRARLAEIEQELRLQRQALDAARDRRGEVAAAAARLSSDLEHLSQTCLNELSLPAQEVRADPSLPRLQGEQLAAEEALYREMRLRLDNMGPVNMMALEEYNQTAERHAFLEGQRRDLLESMANTQSTIQEIDTVSRQKFQEAFERINENFQFTFRKLFGGGQAFMRLTDEENAAESGLDVVASPPGKKLQNVLLLSGGEKALAALALLVGIFQYQPSPFCILDEVDAPLDDANVGRFTELVREMSEQTQFVLITHSKKTMNAAPVLYGVTMQEPGISKLVSVRFGEAASVTPN